MMCSLRHGCNLRQCPANVPPFDLLIGGHGGYVSRYVGSRSTVVAYIEAQSRRVKTAVHCLSGLCRWLPLPGAGLAAPPVSLCHTVIPGSQCVSVVSLFCVCSVPAVR